MLLGPVFHAELITTARRGRYYAIRTLYGLIILCQVYLSYQSYSNGGIGGRGAQLQIREMADFGESIFRTFAILQGVVMLFLTPALVGGTIAEERQRKTLHYLLTSRLGGLEIVLGKLAARLLHVVVLMALGLPVVFLIGLFGGIDFQLLLMSYAGTLTTVYFLATLSILVSVHSRRPREAIAALYVYELIWLFVPTVLVSTMPTWPAPWPMIGEWINPVLEYVAVTSPVYLIRSGIFRIGNLGATLAWGMGLQVVCGTIFVAIAGATLRSAARDDGARRGLAGKIVAFSRKRSWFPRPECGDDGMLWKEKYVARTSGLTKSFMTLVGLSMLGLLGYTMIDFVKPAVMEAWNDGYSHIGPARSDFNSLLRVVCTSIFVLWSLGIASASASGLTSEREEDTWISLIATPLSGREILRAKLIGPVWALRPLAYLMFVLWAIGLGVGSIHPLGVIACLIELVVFTWFLTALGTAFSLRSQNSTRALALTMLTLVFLNGGYLFCCIPLQPNSAVIIAGSTPAVFAVSLLSEENLRDFGRYDQGALMFGSILGVFFYGVASVGLTTWVVESFDTAVDRPDRFRRELTTSQQQAMLRGRAKQTAYGDELS